MDIVRLSTIVGVALAVVAAFFDIPYAGLILGVVGLIGGFKIAASDHIRVIVSALALNYLADTFAELPEAGSILTDILSNLGTALAGAAIMIVLLNIYKRIMP